MLRLVVVSKNNFFFFLQLSSYLASLPFIKIPTPNVNLQFGAALTADGCAATSTAADGRGHHSKKFFLIH